MSENNPKELPDVLRDLESFLEDCRRASDHYRNNPTKYIIDSDLLAAVIELEKNQPK